MTTTERQALERLAARLLGGAARRAITLRTLARRGYDVGFLAELVRAYAMLPPADRAFALEIDAESTTVRLRRVAARGGSPERRSA